MRVTDIMTREVRACSPDESLATAGIRMWDGDCGFLPVVRDGRMVGALTDRDITMAAVLKGRAPAEVTVAEVMSGEVHACSPLDSIATALATMAARQVRRLAVLDPEGVLVGVLSINDVLLAARETPGRAGAPGYYKVVAVLQEIGRHRRQASGGAAPEEDRP
jgi:CBS domain-containing protein